MLKKPEIIDYVLKNKERLLKCDKDRIFITPDIPKKKHNAALEPIHSYLECGSAILLFDDTLWGGAKEGMILTDTIISFKSSSEDSSRAFKLIDINPINEKYLSIDKKIFKVFDEKKHEIKRFSYINEKALTILIEIMSDFVNDQLNWIKQSAENGEVDSQFRYAEFIKQKNSSDYRYRMEKVAQQGHSGAQYSLGLHLIHESKDGDKDKGVYWLKLAIENDGNNSYTMVSMQTLANYYSKIDRKESVYWYKLAHQNGSRVAASNLKRAFGIDLIVEEEKRSNQAFNIAKKIGSTALDEAKNAVDRSQQYRAEMPDKSDSELAKIVNREMNSSPLKASAANKELKSRGHSPQEIKTCSFKFQ
tara:strand:+ start:353 stop:1438 length:1086 start_codon:yes stop_codon:yes gene_type:complete